MEQTGTLQQAMEFVRAGDKPRAARILAQYVTQNPNDDTGWLWLAASLDQPDKQAYCLQKAKALDSTNPNTVDELDFYLGLSGPVYTFDSPINLPPPIEESLEPVVEPDATPPAVSPPAESPTSPISKAAPAKKSMSRSQMTILVVLVILVVVVLVVLGYLMFGGTAAISPSYQSWVSVDALLPLS